MTENDYQRNLMATVVHELKTPIAAVRGFIELVQQVGPLTPMQSRYTERAMDGLQRMELLVADLLEMSRLDTDAPLSLNTCDLGKLIEDSLEMIRGIAQKRNIEIKVEIADDARYVMGDAKLLGHVISNLISNAVKYNRENGTITVSTHAEGEFIQIDVRDTGMGIPDEDIERVFEPFTRLRTKERIEGSGLGLWIAARIIEKHKGRIWVESSSGDGSVFHVTLPIGADLA